jgi:hypothetical protein
MTVDAAFAQAAGSLILEFAPPAIYTPPGGVSVPTIAAIEHVTRQRIDSMNIERVVLARMPAVDVPAPVRGATIIIGADTWTVEALEGDDKTVVTVIVKRVVP